MKKALPFGAYLPDQSANSGVMLEANNCYPRTDGYGPVGDFASQSSALPAAFRGGASMIATDGTSYMLVGTATGLVRYAGGAWTDLVTAMTVTGHWRFAQFGNYAICVNGVTTKVVNLVAGTAGNLAGAPNGVAVAVVGDFVVIAQGSGDLLRVTTSAIADHTGWTPAVNGSTIQPMLTGGEVMGIAGGEYGVILQRQRLVRMSLSGDDLAPFSYNEISPNVGCASKGSILQYGNTVFFLSDRGFMVLEDGQAVRPIGSEKIDRTFLAAVSRDDFELMFSAIDPQNKLVMWAIGNKLYIYNFELDRWTTTDMVCDGVFPGFTSSQTLEQIAVTYPNIDTMPYSLDDPRFSGGNPRLYVVRAGQVGTLSGLNLLASFATGFSDYGKVSRFRSVRPVTDAVAGITLTLDCRARLGDAANARTVSELRPSGAMPVRASGRHSKARLQVAAGTVWSYIQGVEMEMEAGGER